MAGLARHVAVGDMAEMMWHKLRLIGQKQAKQLVTWQGTVSQKGQAGLVLGDGTLGSEWPCHQTPGALWLLCEA